VPMLLQRKWSDSTCSRLVRLYRLYKVMQMGTLVNMKFKVQSILPQQGK